MTSARDADTAVSASGCEPNPNTPRASAEITTTAAPTVSAAIALSGPSGSASVAIRTPALQRSARFAISRVAPTISSGPFMGSLWSLRTAEKRGARA